MNIYIYIYIYIYICSSCFKKGHVSYCGTPVVSPEVSSLFFFFFFCHLEFVSGGDHYCHYLLFSALRPCIDSHPVRCDAVTFVFFVILCTYAH
jgi:hypothetical protein